MNLEDVMALVRAGYTKAEIAAMTSPEHAEIAAMTSPEHAAVPADEPAPQPEPAPEPVPAPASAPATQVSQTEALLREILGAVQQGNINKATMEPPVEKGADVVTARLINPNFGKE